MKIKEGFIISSVADEHVVLPADADLDLSLMITLNDTGKFLWEQLQEEKTEEDLLNVVVENYGDVDLEEAKSFIAEFINELKKLNLLA